MRSPFKFLDPYTQEDAPIFFGRDQEVERLYDFVNKNRLILVYGTSGTGKTSLVQCGLASRFDSTDWYPFFVRRGEDINTSLQQALTRAVGDGFVNDISGAVERINARSLRPVYLIFDQFEELLIMGSPREQETFIRTIRQLLESDLDLDCHIIFLLREEFLARLYTFEQTIPTLLDRRLRVEPMSYAKLSEVITQSCARFNITLEDPEENVRQIIANLSAGKSGLSLPYLQVYLDMLWREDYERTYHAAAQDKELSTGWHGGSGKFPALDLTTEEIARFGAIEDVLARFLTQQTHEIQRVLSKTHQGLSKDTVSLTLDQFVTEEGTKRPIPYTLSEEKIRLDARAPEYLRHLLPTVLTDILERLEHSRLLRLTDEVIELAHDALAALIDGRRSDEQRRLNELYNRLQNNYREYEDSGELLTRRQLTALEEYLPILEPRLDEPLKNFVRKSYGEAERQEQEKREQDRRKQKYKQTLRAATIMSILTSLAIVAGIWAVIERNIAMSARGRAEAAEVRARANLNKFNVAQTKLYLSQAEIFMRSADYDLAEEELKKADKLELDSFQIRINELFDRLNEQKKEDRLPNTKDNQ